MRKTIAGIASEVQEHAQIPERIAELKTGILEIAASLKELERRIHQMEVRQELVKYQVSGEVMKETREVVDRVLGGLNERIENHSVSIALLKLEAERDIRVSLESPAPSLRSRPDSA